MLIKDFQTRYQYNTKTDILGRGGFAVVYKANDALLDRIVALKFFSRSGDDKHTLIQEISRVIALDHPNLCRYYDAALLESTNLHGETDETEVGVMEFLDGGDLKSYCQAHPEHRAKLLIDILNGIAFLHKKGIIHRDLKPQNILIKLTENGPVAKITDFGISKDMKSGDTGSSLLMGTIEYMAPEQFNPQKYGINGKISINLDIWSFGLIVYELITGRHLFGSRAGDSSAEQVMGNILADELIDDKISDLPEPYFYVVKNCLVKDARLRLQNPASLIDKLAGGESGTYNPRYDSTTDAGSTVNIAKGEGETMALPRSPSGEVGAPAKVSNKRNTLILSACAGIALLAGGAYIYAKNANAKTTDNSPTVTTQKNRDSLKANGNKPAEQLPQKAGGGLAADTKNQPQHSSKPTDGTPNKPVAAITSKGPKEYHQTGSYYEGMAAVEDNGKWGFVNEAGKEIIPLIYDDASPFSEGLAAVTKAGKVGFIDKTGRAIVSFIYADSGPFLGGLAIVKKDGKKGFIDQYGREAIPIIYDDAAPFSEGLSKVKKDGKFGFIDKNGSVTIPISYDYAMPFSKGRAMVKVDGKYAYINKAGSIITDTN